MKSALTVVAVKLAMSLPAWGAWIEIIAVVRIEVLYGVAPRMGSVD